ncbi:bifunctional 3-demethylubiquinone-8 3-O-methyltransferase and 2-octaprenyl-6-hydroxyphenol methylase [Gammaproteobacteria bacterium]
MTTVALNADPGELQKFHDIAARWWDPTSEFKALHHINPVRLDYIERLMGISGRTLLEVGCGGGLLTEGLAARGAKTSGIDLAEGPLQVAELHLLESGLTVTYRRVAVETLAAEQPAAFDGVTCMEMLEHVPDPASVVRACATLCRPGGWVFFSTLNRNLKAYILAILGAEYLVGLLPRGTHDYARFIRPSELHAWTRSAGLTAVDLSGIVFHPLTQQFTLGRDTDVNYFMACRRPLP